MDIKKDIEGLTTEKQNEKSMNLDTMSIFEICSLMNEEDALVVQQVKATLPYIEALIQEATNVITNGGHIFYIGAGTSGRIGLLDAVETVPTFSCTDEFQGIIAGGEGAFIKAKEGVEDDPEQGRQDIEAYHVTKHDMVIGLAASGRTPYVIGALKKARELGAKTASISCNQHAKLSEVADYPIEIITGSEVLSGSTRLKAGTAQKLVLNMISTVTMIQTGKVYKNLMVDMKTSNQKLLERSIRMLMTITNISHEEASSLLEKANYQVKTAAVMALLEVDVEEASFLLQKHRGFLRETLNQKETHHD